MAERANPELSAQLEAAFAWWREAGVDCGFTDEPVNWMASNATPSSPRDSGDLAPGRHARPVARVPRLRGETEDSGMPSPARAPTINAASLPQDLSAFTAWWLAEPWLDEGRVADRVPPRGTVGAQLMAIVAEPEREDHQRLLSGPQGRLFDGILAAMGLAPGQVYVASALPRHTPMADWPAMAARGMAEVLVRHVQLVAPRRLIVFGGNVLPLLGNDLPNSGQFLFQVNHGGGSIPLLAAADLGVLLARPRAKAKLWQQWLDGTGPDWMGS